MRQVPIAISVVSLLLLSQLARGEIYKWVDQKGRIHLTNIYRMVPEKYRENVEGRIWVKRVIDGTTLLLSSGERVQLIGVNTSATRGLRRSEGTHMEETYLFVNQLVTGKKVRVEFDSENSERYGRLLAYVYLADGTFLNAEIIKQGYGFADVKYPFNYMEEFRGYEREARENRRGLWKRLRSR
jgi:micrococcal nuclease